MTNVESMDYTHSHPSTIASLSNTAHLSPVSYTHHIPSSKQPPYTYLSWHFHSHSEIYCHATFHCSVYYDTLHHCHVALHDHVVDIVFVARPPFIIVILSVLPFCMGYPEETCWTWFDILIYASTTQKVICSFELSLFSCAFVLSMLIILVVR